MKKIFLVLFCLFLIGCSKEPLYSERTENAGFMVDKLFTHDGCTVYRFEDAWRTVYFVKDQNDNMHTSYDQPCGKNCVEKETVETVK